MEGLTSDDIAALSGGTAHVAGRPIRGASFHSGRVRPGDAFFALPGDRHHGHDFADQAFAKGAAVVVSDRPHPMGIQVADPAGALLGLARHARDRLSGPVVAVTGSAGKTSTKTMMAAAVDARSTAGNFNTPYPLACSLIDAFLDDRPERPLVLEVGIDRPGEMLELAALVRPSHAFVTLVSASHLETLGDVAQVGSEKAELLAAADRRFASAQASRWLPPDMAATVESYAVAPEKADHTSSVLETYPGGQRLAYGSVACRLPVPGRGMAANATAALLLASELGLDPEVAAARLQGAQLEAGRLSVEMVGAAYLVDDSYNSNPASALEALEVLRELPRPHVAVIGDMLELGPASREMHRTLGSATLGIDRVMAVGAEAEALLGGNAEAEYYPTTAAAEAAVGDLSRSGAVLFKASRGMAFERLVAIFRSPVRQP